LPKDKPLWEVNKELVDVATGRAKADLVIKGGDLVNVYTGEIIENVDVAVKHGRIAYVGNAEHTIGDNTLVVKAEDRYIAPGLLDGHLHIESTMLTVTQFARAVLPHGTTGVFIDPHEIANVLGIKGVKLMVDESKTVPLRVFVCVPSCVPASSPEFETSGATIDAKEVEEALSWDGVIGLAEVMNFPGVIAGDDKMFREINVTLKKGKTVEGHISGIVGRDLVAYVAAGITSCHESTKLVEAAEKLRLGMYVMAREGSAWKDLAEVIKVVTQKHMDYRRVILVTDDMHPEDIWREGHMNRVVRRAIEEGVDPIRAIQMATLNTAEHYRVDHEIGGIAPSRCADIILIRNLSKMDVEKVFVGGELVAENGKMVVEFSEFKYPDYALKTVHLKKPLEVEDLKIKAPIENGTVKAHVIGVEEDKVVTKHLIEEVDVVNGEAVPSINRDIAKAAVVERHKGTGNIGLGFVKGFELKAGAVGSTVGHDSHNMIIVGVNDQDMVLAGNKLAEVGGGLIVVKDGKVLELLELPIAGLMSDRPVEEVSEKVAWLGNAWRALGCTISSPFMLLSMLALPVIPELRLTDKGLVDVVKFEKISLFEEGK